MRTGYSCYLLDPYRVAEEMGDSAQYLELLAPRDGLRGAEELKRNLLDPKGIRPILTLLLLPRGVFFDTGGEPAPWGTALPLLDVFQPRVLRVVGVPGEDGEEALIARAVSQIESIRADLNKRSISLAYENHGEKAATVRRIVEGFEGEFVGVLLDPSNGYLSDEDPLHVMDELLPLARYLHVKDVPLDADGERAADSCALGEGNADWSAYAERIKAAGADYLFVFELPGYAGDVFDGYRKSLAALQGLLSS